MVYVMFKSLQIKFLFLFIEEEEEEEETFICNRPYGPWTKLLYTIHNEKHGHVTMVNYLN